jgi:hypothetical protein
LRGAGGRSVPGAIRQTGGGGGLGGTGRAGSVSTVNGCRRYGPKVDAGNLPPSGSDIGQAVDQSRDATLDIRRVRRLLQPEQHRHQILPLSQIFERIAPLVDQPASEPWPKLICLGINLFDQVGHVQRRPPQLLPIVEDDRDHQWQLAVRRQLAFLDEVL